MCLSCGCQQPDNAHGDSRNITRGKLRQAQKAGDRKSLKHTSNTMTHTLKKRGK